MAESDRPFQWSNESRDDEFEDREFPDQDDLCDDESAELVACTECGADIYEDAPQCPVCGAYVVRDTRAWSGRSSWWILLVMLGIVALITALVLGR
jgi:hypothetical protein